MKSKDLIALYQQDSLVKIINLKVTSDIKEPVLLKGLSGSLDSVVVSSIIEQNNYNHIIILHDKEEAAYFLNDLQHLLTEQPILLFPASYKKAYEFHETENANVLLRAEVLNKISSGENTREIIVTYPEALSEKVINKKSLVKNTFNITKGQQLDTAFVIEFLNNYNFEKTDFVYEAGQYAIRGGIIDIFSYANELPYRIELFGTEIESIRSFNPDNQLSLEHKNQVSIIPNIQDKMLTESRESFLEYIPENSILWFKDLRHCGDIIDKYFIKGEDAFLNKIKNAQGSTLISKPEQLFESKENFEKNIQPYTTVEFGKQQYFNKAETFEFNSQPQPSFNKEFKLLTEDLKEKQIRGYRNFIAAESHQQLDRLITIFEEIEPSLSFETINISLREGFVDHQQKIACYTDHQVFERFHRYKSKERYSKSKAITLKELQALQPGDYVTHADYGIARFAGLERIELNDKRQEAIRLVFRDDDLMLVSIHALHKISKYSGKDGSAPVMSKLGSGDWDEKKKKVKKQVKDIAKDLIKLYAKRKAAHGFAFSKDGFLQAELESSFIYEDTPDQGKAAADVKKDMEQAHPMDRLVCGDVGFGKTEVAIRAAFKAVCDGKQVAVLVPTTILAMQHYKTFKERLKNFPCMVEYLNRFKTGQQVKETLKRVAEGKTNILIGTHKIIGKDVKFDDLGLLVIDEEQKFGVKVKERLKEFKVNVDTLTLTATPIPRTLQFSLMGARDFSIIATPPPNRQPVTTEIHVFNEALIRDAVTMELKRGGQVFIVHNRVSDIEHLVDTVKRLIPDAKVAYAHGQMEGAKLEKAMMAFVDGDYDVLVSTNIIESGLDIPNANTIIINRAHMFGLSDLHQMRGRVGRSNKKAFCYLLTPPIATLPSDARKRLSVLEEFSDLGDGFKVAMRDLDIRGAGNLLGAEQSGFINDLGFELYHKILDETIEELKETEFKNLFKEEIDIKKLTKLVDDCTLETDLSILIPDTYISNVSERLQLYAKLDNLKTEEELQAFIHSLEDRFGALPEEVIHLTETVRLRWLALKLGFEKLVLKSDTLKCFFSADANEDYYKSEVFGKIIQYIQSNPRLCRLKEMKKKLILTFDKISSIESSIKALKAIDQPKVLS